MYILVVFENNYLRSSLYISVSISTATCMFQLLTALLHSSTRLSNSGMLRNLTRHVGIGSFSIFISARGDRWISITLRHRFIRGMTLLSYTFHSFISFTNLEQGLVLNLCVLNTPEEHPDMRKITAAY